MSADEEKTLKPFAKYSARTLNALRKEDDQIKITAAGAERQQARLIKLEAENADAQAQLREQLDKLLAERRVPLPDDATHLGTGGGGKNHGPSRWGVSCESRSRGG